MVVGTKRLAQKPPNGLAWGLGILTFGIGDTATTIYGIKTAGVIEANRLALILISEFTIWALIPVKFLFILLALLAWYYIPEPHNFGIPLGLATLGTAVLGWNIAVLIIA